MGHAPSLLCLCCKALASSITQDNHHWKCVNQLPLDLVGDVLINLPPLTLHALQEQLLGSSRVMQCCCDCNLMAGNATKKRKRERILGYQVVSCNRTSFASSDTCSKQLNEQTLLNEEETRTDLQTCFNSVWKDRFYIRWPKGVKQTGFLASLMEDNTNAKSDLGIYRKDWQQCYWEAHLQECLREAAGQALIPSFEGSIANIILSDAILEHIGVQRDFTCMEKDTSTLKYHCQQFGQYARHLQLRNVLCVGELSDLLRRSRLQGVVFHDIKSKNHIEGTCQILNQNRETLEAVELFHCRLSSDGLDDICASLISADSPMHRVQFFAVTSSRVLVNDDHVSLHGFLKFLSSGRFFHSLKLSDNGLEPKTAALIFNALFSSQSDLSVLELCDNKLSGWLSSESETFFHLSSLPPNEQYFMRSLTSLNLRGNFLESQDVERLKIFLYHLPQLQKLDLSDNPIGDFGIRSGATPLANFLKKTHIERLDIEGIGLGPSGCNQLLEAISCMQALVYFNMSKNRGGFSAAIMLCKIISYAQKLSVIDASYNFFCLESLKLIASALKQFKGQLKFVDLRGSPAGYQAKCLGLFDELPIVILPSSPLINGVHDDDP